MVVINRYFSLRVFMFIFTMVALALAKTREPTKHMPPGGSLWTGAVVGTGNCSCGGFATDTPAPGAQPLIAQCPLTVPCTLAGSDTCGYMCVALAAATEAKGPQILCTRLVNATELKLAAFYKVCDQPWSYSGKKAKEALCCINTEVTQCASAATALPAPPGIQPSTPAAANYTAVAVVD